MAQEKAVSFPQEAFLGVAAILQSLIDQALLDDASQPAVPVLPVKRRIPSEERQMVQGLRVLSEAVWGIHPVVPNLPPCWSLYQPPGLGILC